MSVDDIRNKVRSCVERGYTIIQTFNSVNKFTKGKEVPQSPDVIDIIQQEYARYHKEVVRASR